MPAVDVNNLLTTRIVTFTAKCLSEHTITQVFRSLEIVCSGNSYCLTSQRAFSVGNDLGIYAHW